MRTLVELTPALVGAILSAFSLPACTQTVAQPVDDTAETQQKQVSCHRYQDSQGVHCAICFRWHWAYDEYGSWKELDEYTESCGD
jgi:hypothetical protein